MPHSQNIIQRYYDSPTTVKEEIITIFKVRHFSTYQKNNFQEVLLQIENALNLNTKECPSLAQILLLLQDLFLIAPEDISDLWKKKPERNVGFKYFFVHGDQHFHCTWCGVIQTTATYLDSIMNTKVNPNEPELKTALYRDILAPGTRTPNETKCILCQSPDVNVKLQCDHLLCYVCKRQKIKKLKNSYLGYGSFKCPSDRISTSLYLLENSPKLDVEKVPAETHNYYQNRSGTSVDTNTNPTAMANNKVHCPRCHLPVFLDHEEGMLAECLKCDFCFCSNCLQDFHGLIECVPKLDQESTYQAQAPGPVERPANPNPSTLEDQRIKGQGKDSVQGGAAAEAYELEFYKDVRNRYVDADDILAAFDHPAERNQLPKSTKLEWPWDMVSYINNDYPHPYESLRVGNWVEDELLEKVIKIVVSENKLQDKVAVLESFVMNWSLLKQEDGELMRLIKEKKLLRKELVLALINTDISGHGGHWILAVINVPRQTIVLLDSSLNLSYTFYQKFFYGLLHLLHIAYQVERRERFDASKWKFSISLDSTQQENAYDCGPLVVCNAFAIATKGVQLDRLPKSYMVREWLYQSLINLSLKGKDTQENRSSVEQNPIGHQTADEFKSLDNFAPSGLKIEFTFFKNYNFI